MEVKAVSKYNRMSARKARLAADMVRGQKVTEAFHILSFTPKKAAKLVMKTLKSAVANAEHNLKLDKNDLVISKITVDEGPTLKRHRPVAKGRTAAIKKRTSHVTVAVEEVKKDKSKTKKAIKEVKGMDDKSGKSVVSKTENKKLENKNGS